MKKFTLIINRKGHRNEKNLTIMLNSKTLHEPMVRFDVNGSDHANPPDKKRVPTPHLHIFTEEFAHGSIAIPLSEITDVKLVDELFDALDFFMDYSTIKKKGIEIKSSLF